MKHQLLSQCLFGALLMALLVPAVFAQDQEDVIRVRTDLVSVPVVVLDARGNRVFGLKAEDFQIRDNGRTVKLDHFSNGTDHVALAFLLDASGSAREYLARQRDAALSLCERFGPGSEVAVMHFSEKLKVAVPFTTDLSRARSGFDFPAASDRHTAIFDSAATLIQMFNQQGIDPSARRIIVLTSDGLDTASATRGSTVVGLARTGAISFYVIHFPLFTPSEGRLVARQPAKGFRDLADKTGGGYFTVGDSRSALDPNAAHDLTKVFKAIEDDLASQYVLGFYAGDSAHDGGVHRIEVQLTRNNHGLRLKALRDEYRLKQ